MSRHLQRSTVGKSPGADPPVDDSKSWREKRTRSLPTTRNSSLHFRPNGNLNASKVDATRLAKLKKTSTSFRVRKPLQEQHSRAMSPRGALWPLWQTPSTLSTKIKSAKPQNGESLVAVSRTSQAQIEAQLPVASNGSRAASTPRFVPSDIDYDRTDSFDKEDDFITASDEGIEEQNDDPELIFDPFLLEESHRYSTANSNTEPHSRLLEFGIDPRGRNEISGLYGLDSTVTRPAHAKFLPEQTIPNQARVSSHKTNAKVLEKRNHSSCMQSVSYTISADYSGDAEKLKKLAILKEPTRTKFAGSKRDLKTRNQKILPYVQTDSEEDLIRKKKRKYACKSPGCFAAFIRDEYRLRHELKHGSNVSYNDSQQDCKARVTEAMKNQMATVQQGQKSLAPDQMTPQMQQHQAAVIYRHRQAQLQADRTVHEMAQQYSGIDSLAQKQLQQRAIKLWHNARAQAAQEYGSNTPTIPLLEQHALQQQAPQRARQMMQQRQQQTMQSMHQQQQVINPIQNAGTSQTTPTAAQIHQRHQAQQMQESHMRQAQVLMAQGHT